MPWTTSPRASGVRKGPRALAPLAVAAMLAALGTVVFASPIETMALGTSASPGVAWAWGSNSDGQLGDGVFADSSTPVPVRLPSLTLVTAIAGGEFNSLALTSSGQVLAWGSNHDGELGNGTLVARSNTPVAVSQPSGTSVTAIAGGGFHDLARTSTGQVLAWGLNTSGQLGNGTTTIQSNLPVAVSLPSGTTVTTVAAGRFFSLALTSTGQVLGWGQNSGGELGNGTTTQSYIPVAASLPSGTTVTAIAGGSNHSLAVTSTGQMLAWGNNFTGQLGNGTTTGSNTPVAVSLPSGTTVTAVAGGASHSLALTSSGQVLAWGNNFSGQLGNGTTTNSTTPVPVSLPSGTTVTAIAAGLGHSLALTSTGEVLAWGDNTKGELGNSTGNRSTTPVAVNTLQTAVTAIAGAGQHSLAVQLLPTVAVLPAVSNGAYGGYVTAATVQNTGTSTAIVRIAYFDQNGSPVGVGDSINLPVNAGWTVRQDNGNSFPSSGGDSAQAGSAVVLSSQPVAAFVNEFAPGNVGDATSYSGVQVAGGVGTTLYAPTIVNNAYGGYTTGIGLLNQGNSLTNVTVTYRDGSGSVIKTQTVFGLAAHAYKALYSGDATLALPSGFAGTATITSGQGQPLGAIVNETGPGGQFSSYDAVPSGSMTLNVPVALNNAFGGYFTGMGIQNTTSSPGLLSVTYYDAAGTPTVKNFTIPASGSLGIYQGSVTDGPPVGAYTAVIQSSTVTLAAIVNEVAPANGAAQQSTSYNTFSAGSATLRLPLVENAGSDPWNTGEGIMNTGTSSAAVQITYYDTVTGAAIGTPQAQALAPHAFWGVYQPTGGLPSGTRATAVITTSAGGQVAVICNESSTTTFMSYDGQ
jgi:alpha-tubulin suppressor-like RCC1 family protein